MECRRCQGWMVEDHFFDCEGTQGFMWMKGWRYMNRSHTADPLIEANRRLHDATELVRPSEEPENEKEHVYLRPKPSHGLPHDGGVGSTVPTRRNSVLARTNTRVSYDGDHSDHR